MYHYCFENATSKRERVLRRHGARGLESNSLPNQPNRVLRSATAGVPGEHGRFSDVIQTKVQEDDALQAHAAATMRRAAVSGLCTMYDGRSKQCTRQWFHGMAGGKVAEALTFGMIEGFNH